MSKGRIMKFPLAFTTKKKKTENTIFETHNYEQDKNIIQIDLSEDLMTLSSNTEGTFQKA